MERSILAKIVNEIAAENFRKTLLNSSLNPISAASVAGALALCDVLWLRLLRDEEATTLSSSALLVPQLPNVLLIFL
jgi:hypothetical protein